MRWASFCDEIEQIGFDQVRGGRAAEVLMEKEARKLSPKARKNLDSGVFVFPKERRYPIHDESHARNALARASGKSEEARVRAAVHARYPGIGKEKTAVSRGWIADKMESGFRKASPAMQHIRASGIAKRTADKADKAYFRGGNLSRHNTFVNEFAESVKRAPFKKVAYASGKKTEDDVDLNFYERHPKAILGGAALATAAGVGSVLLHKKLTTPNPKTHGLPQIPFKPGSKAHKLAIKYLAKRRVKLTNEPFIPKHVDAGGKLLPVKTREIKVVPNTAHGKTHGQSDPKKYKLRAEVINATMKAEHDHPGAIGKNLVQQGDKLVKRY